MRIGTLCYAHSRGLGHLARSFVDHGVVTDVCVVRHPSIPMHADWYPSAPVTDLHRLDARLLRDFTSTMDAMLFFETPFDWNLFDFCRKHGIRTALVTMYECTPAQLLAEPDLFLCPSLLDLDYFPKKKSVFLPLPVDPVKTPWKLRTHAQFFIHNGGYLGLRGREGTELLIESMQYVKSPIRLRIRVQENVSPFHQQLCARDKRIEYIPENVSYEQLFSDGDVYIAPQKFNGCSLPLQEAFASGLCVMTTNRYPMNTWLPNEPMIPVQSYSRVKVGGPYNTIDEAKISRIDIAKTIDDWYGKDITDLSLRGRQWALNNSWAVLRNKYLDVLSSIP